MRETDGERAATAEPPATPSVAPRFTRAAEAERSAAASEHSAADGA